MAERKRAKISITLDPETLAVIDQISERFGENRSRVLERLVSDGVWQHRNIGKASGTLPEIRELYRRVIVYSDRYELTGISMRAKAYDLRWEDLPPELKVVFPPNRYFPEWNGTAEMLGNEREGLEHELESVKQRLEGLNGMPGKSAKRVK